MIDTHCHLTYEGLQQRIDAVVADASAAGVSRLITIGTNLEHSRLAVATARRFPGVFASIGIHPHHALECLDKAELHAGLAALVGDEKVVAWGEMGLDYHYPDPPKADQRRVLEWQLELVKGLDETARQAASQKGMPIIIHNREATDDTLAVLRGCGIPADRFLFHCFTGTAGEFDQIMDFGAMIGFTGIVTFKSARPLAELAGRVPLDRLVIETDAPYLTPEPHRKIKTNEPKFVVEVAKFIAPLRNMSVAELEEVTDANARRFFRLP